MKYDKVTIQHNHGEMVLVDVSVEEYSRGAGRTGKILCGVVAGGGVTSRLFSATSYKPYEIGAIETYDVYGYDISKANDGWIVNCQFCG